MGLDMYAYAIRRELPQPMDFKEPEDATELHTWRKHPNLHGWMEALYRGKGGSAEIFNCVPVALTTADLDALEATVRARTLPRTQGFFFGASDGSELEDDLCFIGKAREALSAGLAVFYSSWW